MTLDAMLARRKKRAEWLAGIAAADRHLKPEPASACGTRGGYQAHRLRDETACARCRAAEAAYARGLRRGIRSRVLKPCGTSAAYLRHWRRGETACAACRAAHAADKRRKRRRQWSTEHQAG